MASAISDEEAARALSKAIKHGSIRALELWLQYRFGRPWTESELLEAGEIEAAEKAIAEARERQRGQTEAAQGGSAAGYGHETAPSLN